MNPNFYNILTQKNKYQKLVQQFTNDIYRQFLSKKKNNKFIIQSYKKIQQKNIHINVFCNKDISIDGFYNTFGDIRPDINYINIIVKFGQNINEKLKQFKQDIKNTIAHQIDHLRQYEQGILNTQQQSELNKDDQDYYKKILSLPQQIQSISQQVWHLYLDKLSQHKSKKTSGYYYLLKQSFQQIVNERLWAYNIKQQDKKEIKIKILNQVNKLYSQKRQPFLDSLANNWYGNIKMAKQPIYPLFYDYLHNNNQEDDWVKDGTDLKDKTQVTELGLQIGGDQTTSQHPFSDVDPQGRSQSPPLPTQDTLMDAYDTGKDGSKTDGSSWDQHNPIQHDNQAFYNSLNEDPSNALGISQTSANRLYQSDRQQKDRDPRQLSRMSSVWNLYLNK